MTIFGFLIKSMFRRKLLVTLSMLSLTTAFLLFILLRSVAVLFSGDVIDVPDVRMQTNSKYAMIFPLPHRYGEEIAAVEGVLAVTFASWFGGTFREGDTSAMTFAVDPSTYFEVHENYQISTEHLEAFLGLRTAAVAPEAIMYRYDLEVGEKVPVTSSIYPNTNGEPWTFDLVGTYRSENESEAAFLPFLFHYEYLKEASGESDVGWYTFTIEDPDKATEIAQIVDSKFENTADKTKTMTESQAFRNMMEQFGDISLMMNGIIGAVFFTMLLLTANTMIHSYRQRIPDLAVLKTLGFSDGKVARYMIFESLLFCTSSAAVGIGIAVATLALIGPYLPSGFVLIVTWNTLFWGTCIAVGLGLFIGLVPAFSANRLVIVDALHAR
ncbi:MAG: ABC transporter permease [Gammaproteobacteria bacterium]|nr:ABC transporter permease [Gammaproteobacteria bacterium]MYF03197.1 ABC transporter permease [Gammaproteobacteria bacterium]